LKCVSSPVLEIIVKQLIKMYKSTAIKDCVGYFHINAAAQLCISFENYNIPEYDYNISVFKISHAVALHQRCRH